MRPQYLRIFRAQELFARRGELSVIQLKLANSREREAAIAALREFLPKNARVASRGATYRGSGQDPRRFRGRVSPQERLGSWNVGARLYVVEEKVDIHSHQEKIDFTSSLPIRFN